MAFDRNSAHACFPTGRNLHTGETIEIAAAKVPAFKPGKALKDAIQQNKIISAHPMDDDMYPLRRDFCSAMATGSPDSTPRRDRT